MALRTVVASMALAAVSVQAQKTINTDDIDCPDNWSFGSINDETFCCFGSSHIVNGEGSCCVGPANDPVEFDDCFPFCDDDEDNGVNVSEPSCATEIPYTASNYMSLVSAASRSVMSDSPSATEESSSMPATTSAEPTNSGSTDDDDDDNDDDGDDGDDGNGSTGGDGGDSSESGNGGDGNQSSNNSGGNGGDGGDGGDGSSNEGGSNDDSDEDDDDNAGSALTGHFAVQFGAAFAIAALIAL